MSGDVLVTGGAGFIGSHVVDALLARGERVRVLVRPTTDRRFVPADRVAFVPGDVGDESPSGAAELARACAGVRLVVHAAAITQARRSGDFARVNARGTERVVQAARDAAVSRVLLVSSQAAAGPTPGPSPRVESDPDAPVGAYGRSKLAAERAARTVLADGSTSLVIVRPPAVYGPRDQAFLALFKLVRAGIVPLHRPERQWVSIVHARDLATGLLLAGERGAPGSTYYVSDGVPRTSASIVDTVAQAMGRRPLRLDPPAFLLRLAVNVAEGLAGVTGAQARLTSERLVDWMAPRWTVSHEAARRELGFEPVIGFKQGIEETAAWYRNIGWI
jgi:nucleoside-diphosphate-sugar epimerase